MSNQKYDQLRYLAATGGLDWVADSISLVVVSGYVFDQTHATLTAITTAGATVVGSGQLNNKTALTTGRVTSDDVSVAKIPAGTYQAILVVQKFGNSYPLVFLDATYLDEAFVLASGGDLIFRPNGDIGDGVWVTF